MFLVAYGVVQGKTLRCVVYTAPQSRNYRKIHDGKGQIQYATGIICFPIIVPTGMIAWHNYLYNLTNAHLLVAISVIIGRVGQMVKLAYGHLWNMIFNWMLTLI